MGLFDNFLKQIDTGLKAVEDGALEEKLNQVAETFDKTTEKTEKALAKAAGKPSQILHAAETKREQLEQRASKVKAQWNGRAEDAPDAD